MQPMLDLLEINPKSFGRSIKQNTSVSQSLSVSLFIDENCLDDWRPCFLELVFDDSCSSSCQ